MKHLDNESLKILEEEIEEDARTWKDLPCSILTEYVQPWEEDCTLTVIQEVE